METNAIVPIEINMYVIYHEPTKRSFQYDQKTMQFKQIILHECELFTRHLLHQDVIFHRITGVTYSNRQKQSLSDIDRQMKQKKPMTMKGPHNIDDFIPYIQDSDLWVKMPFPHTETSQI